MITSSESGVAVAIYDTHTRAEEAVKALQHAGFDMKTISIVGKDYHSEEHVLGYFNTGDRMKFFGKLGAFWGGLAGIFFGSAMMFIPVVGHVIILGPLAATLFGGLEGAVLGGGAAALVGALTAIGVPEDSVLRYETALKADKFLLVLNADAVQVKLARAVLGSELESFGRPNP
ncbi:MAG: general stress protein [Pseudomonadota bacterium]|nr:general stress protein [Pseudomonadota bacterium]